MLDLLSLIFYCFFQGLTEISHERGRRSKPAVVITLLLKWGYQYHKLVEVNIRLATFLVPCTHQS